MVRAYFGTLTACALALLAFAAGDRAVAGQDATVAGLAGRWAGDGRIIPASGASEDFKCVITYFPSDDGSRVRQNLRCKGLSYAFDAATNMEIDGAKITGRWSDNIYSLNGTVSGALTNDGFSVQLSGQFFEARMTVVSTRCEQLVTVIPDQATQMKELSAVLRKC